uniref:DNA-directed RNA polymerases IV and V subunit 4 isoform X1 n=1 Tax=Fragaria vesca subsp. vesca TaxID=101020 RepID=UPI0005CADB8F|nr:PREDICTED: DNA-directed RNA polymerases IV and V subunit 4 isoform X1 [Fragaria vesca subsp. vesca]XP_011460072.1 PREDICTED: DNA-directed RNA polymerases IV and V subunit 4 isoform X1 [Fragaria vesca subsp. vesca]
MSDKGGKGFTAVPKGKGKGGKSSLKEATPKGKDDGPAKSKKTRNVQFSSQAAASTKANSGKGGQADGGAKKDKEPLQLKLENELPKGAKCLMDCEAADILQGVQDHMVILSKDPSIKLPVSFDRALQYTEKSTNYTDPESVRQVLQNLKTYGVTDGEICVMANVYPETADEVFALLPSLKARRIMLDDPVNDVLSELAKLKKSA